MKAVESQHLITDSSDELVLKVLDLLEQRWVNQDQLDKLTQTFCDNQDKLGFLREFMLFIRELPEALFSDLEQRQHWLNLCQALLDIAIEQEEEALANGQ
jgi:type III secretion system TyeA family effector delivery regulator